ncbi:ABC transporter substrate-binding protein [Alcaligenes sp. 13f]|uniref:ABC transporter substrate-binding protein n=1 Tax=Alcaligenes sp. 13f TaxID=2841924 RepID=UPI001CF6C159|nr:ABC transporter substrate-binding protein [Alcaligenes sp. 13f]MCB4321458.1 ABC transporter substrate-binding protein [Alcaligenes sp. 13f]
MQKKVLAGVISVWLLVAAMPTLAQQKDVELRMSWWGGNSRHSVTLKALAAFQKHYPHIKVKAEYTGWDGHLARLTTQIAGNTEPDVLQVNWNWLPKISRNGTGFMDMYQLQQDIDLEQFPQSELDMVTIKGKLNGVPVSSTARLFYYNTQTWQKAGIDYPRTWDELLAAGRTFREKLGERVYPVVLEHQDALALLRAYMVQKYNIAEIDEDKKSFAYSDEQWVEFFSLYKEMVDAHVMPSAKEFASFGHSNMYEKRPWIQGDWGGTYMWNSTISKYADNLTPPATLALGPHPMLPGAIDAGLFNKPSMLFAVGKSSRHPREAAQLINFLLNSDEGVDSLGLERGIPLSKVAFARLEQADVIKPELPAVAGLELAAKLPKRVVVSPYFDDPQIVALFGETIQSIDYGNRSVQEAAMQFKRDTNRILRRVMR